MVSFFHGNAVLVKEAVQKRVTAFLKQHPQGIIQNLRLTEPEQIDRLAQELQTRSFFNEKKLLVINGAFAVGYEKLGDLLKRYWQDPSSDLELIFQEDDNPEKGNKKFFELINKRAETVQSFGELRGAKLQKRVEEKLREAGPGITITVKAVQKLIAGSSGQRLEQELAKLIAYKSYQGPLKSQESTQIKEEEIDALVYADLTLNNFALADAIAGRDRRQSLELLHFHLAEGEDPYALLGLLVYQFRNLLRVKALVKKPVVYAELAGLTKLHPFVLRKSYDQAKKFELADLVRIYQDLFKLEVGAKEGRLDLPLALHEFILRI